MITVTVKIGGRAAAEKEPLIQFLREIGELSKATRFILVHGGGAEVSKVAKVFGLEPVFRDGVRITSPDEMDIVDMVLAGKMNKYLVRTAGLFVPAVGISGSDGRTFTGEPIACDDEEETCTGKITAVDPALINLLLENGYLPVVSSTSVDPAGRPLNINADEAALGIASAIQCSSLIFLSDVPGILKEDKVVSVLTKTEVESEITDGVIAGGMIPKVRSSVSALEKGVGEIIIGNYTEKGDLNALINGSKGSRIILK